MKLALLWHMHQPYYEDLATGEHILPWVRLHAIKDYWGMVAMLEEFPGVRVTFNLVPSLIKQVQAFADNRAKDRHLEVGLKAAAQLTPDEARWMIANGFHAPYARMIGPYPRYAQLHAYRMERRPFSEEDLRDLQVWHKLAWMDPDLLVRDARLASLIERDRDFTEADKLLLRQIELELLSRVVPAYRAASERGIELATSPFYHPILPLLCDSDAHQHAQPGAPKPRQRFTRPEDARLQIQRAVEFHEASFGSRPSGMWPSEGSVSDEAVALIGAAGLKWMATDEDILSRSLKVQMRPELLYRPYRIGNNGPVALFRDHAMSDRIGFHYQSWEAGAAAADFVEQVRAAGHRFVAGGGGEVATVSVILDGENAWEYYDGGGRPFLRALYTALSEAPDIETVTMSEAAAGPAQALPSIFPGSWINGDFYIWIGHRDDHRAWDQLSDARATFDRHANQVEPGARERALEELLIAEGSDWFWWYGDDHSSDHDADFDDLFRRHLRNSYTALGVPIPEELFATNISTGTGPDRLEPSGVLSVTLDGKDTSFLEWVGAVAPTLARPGGAMHEVTASPLIGEVRVGVSASGLCLRLSSSELPALIGSGAASLAVVLGGADVRVVPIERSWQALGPVIEIQVPFDRIAAPAAAEIQFAIQIRDRADAVLESIPHGRHWTIAVPQPGFISSNWQA
ncbi:MAG TPA: glycoside hydrolase family 57 protein [Vicinamibacterales bacterium]|nr:glycoside hydrolase family 57 protein [Vicinamibacterales bacterium]